MRARRRGKGAAWLAGLAVLAVGAGLALFNLDRIRAEIRLYREFESLGKNPQGYRMYRHRQAGIVFVRLPGGTFLMGSPEGEEGRQEDEFQHRVTVSPFLIAEDECRRPRFTTAPRSRVGSFAFVVANDNDISPTWEDCQQFCRETKLELPTEAQWEYACRAGSTTPFAFGSSLPAASVKYRQSEEDRVKPVPRPNGFGLYFVHDNVREWCRDTYYRDYYRGPAASGLDPVNLADSNLKVLRGGSWKSPAPDCRSARRIAGVSFMQYEDSGFRPVWSFYPAKD